MPAATPNNAAPAGLATPVRGAKAHPSASPAAAPVSGAGGTPSTAGTSPSKRQQGAQKHTFGVLHTGYLEKMNPARGVLDKPKKRFVVLTHVGIHWFKRTEGYDLFGEERGSIAVQDIAKVELVRVGGESGTATRSSPSPSPSPNHQGALDAFEVSCKQDVVRRVFQAPSPEEAQAWVAAVKAAIKARSLYRRETLQGISFLPHGHDAAHEEAPLVSVITLRRPGEAHELVLAKGPEYHYGQLFTLPYLVSNAPTTTAAATVPLPSPGKSPRPIITPTPRGGGPIDGGADGVVCILLSNGDSAVVPVRALTERVVGDTVQVKVTSLAGHAAHLPLTIEATSAAKPAEEAAAGKGKKEALLLSTITDVAAPVLFAVLLALWTHAEHGGSRTSISLAALPKDRLALAALVGLGLLRAALGALEAAKAKKAAAAAAARRMVLRVSVDDYVHDARGRGESAGAAAEDELPPIPKRFVDGCLGDMVEAERRWRITHAWRSEYGTDKILEQPHPYFKLIKECYPSYYCMSGRDGNPVYYERCGQVDQPRLKAAGCGTDELLWHYVYATEYCWTHISPREEAKTITVFDVEGVGIRDLAGDAFEFLRKSIALISDHYPERSLCIMIVNAPSWFSFLWKMIKPMVNERTQKKVKIVAGGRETFECISEFVDPKNIPKRYGGELSYGDELDCRWSSPEEVAVRKHVEAVNAKLGVEFKMG